MNIKALISRKAAYKEGYEAGKLEATKQLFEEFEQMLENRRAEADSKKAKYDRIDHGQHFYTGQSVVCSEFLYKLRETKRKRGVK